MSTALDIATDLLGKAGKPAYVEFTTVPKELVKRSKEEGRYIAIDVDMVTVRQIGSVDSCVFKVESWLAQNKIDVQAQRLPREHADFYEKSYRRWKDGQEMPLTGTPIKGWAVISPAQSEAVLRLGIRTVEDLAAINDEAKARIGMGAIILKNKAQAWLAQAQDKGPLTMQMAAIQQENDVLKLTLATLQEQVEALRQAQKAQTVSHEPRSIIGEEAIFDVADSPWETPEPQPKRGPGRPRKEA